MEIPRIKGRLSVDDSGGVNPLATYELETKAKPTYAPEGCTFPHALQVQSGDDQVVLTFPFVTTDPDSMEMKLINSGLVE